MVRSFLLLALFGAPVAPVAPTVDAEPALCEPAGCVAADVDPCAVHLVICGEPAPLVDPLPEPVVDPCQLDPLLCGEPGPVPTTTPVFEPVVDPCLLDPKLCGPDPGPPAAEPLVDPFDCGAICDVLEGVEDPFDDPLDNPLVVPDLGPVIPGLEPIDPAPTTTVGTAPGVFDPADLEPAPLPGSSTTILGSIETVPPRPTDDVRGPGFDELPPPPPSTLPFVEIPGSDRPELPDPAVISDAELLREAESLLLLEIGALTALDAFADPSVWFRSISSDLGFDQLDRTEAIEELALIEDRALLLLAEMDRRGLEVPVEVRGRLQRNDPEFIAELAAGRAAPIAVEPHTRALASVLGRNGTTFATTDGLDDVEVASLLEGVLDARLAELAAERQDERRSSLLLIGVLAIALFLALVVVVSLLRRRDDATRAADDLVAAGSRLTGTLDADEVRTIAGAEAQSLTGVAAVVRPVEQIDAAHQPLARAAVEGGSTVRGVAADGSPVAVAPVESGGGDAEVLVLVGAPGSAITEDHLRSIGSLTPMISSALSAAHSHRSLSELALIDELTGLLNRRALDVDIAGVEAPACVVMVDVDHFKRFNDRHGHVAGDRVLQRVADIMCDHVRHEDGAYRYGGEEFCLILTGVDAAAARPILERLRSAVEAGAHVAEGDTSGEPVTVSLGLAVRAAEESAEAWLERADAALYVAKRAGRNRLVTAD